MRPAFPGAIFAGLLAGGASAAPLARVSVEIQFGGNQAIAGHLRQILPHQIARELDGHPVRQFPAGARLIVRIREVFLSSDFGSSTFSSSEDAIAISDAIDGEAVIVDPRGAVIARKAIAGRSHPSNGGGLPTPYNEPARIEALSAILAYWVVREFD